MSYIKIVPPGKPKMFFDKKSGSIGMNCFPTSNYGLDIDLDVFLKRGLYINALHTGSNLYSTGIPAIHLHNSDIVGMNRLFFNDASESDAEGIQFPRTDFMVLLIFKVINQRIRIGIIRSLINSSILSNGNLLTTKCSILILILGLFASIIFTNLLANKTIINILLPASMAYISRTLLHISTILKAMLNLIVAIFISTISNLSCAESVLFIIMELSNPVLFNLKLKPNAKSNMIFTIPNLIVTQVHPLINGKTPPGCAEVSLTIKLLLNTLLTSPFLITVPVLSCLAGFSTLPLAPKNDNLEDEPSNSELEQEWAPTSLPPTTPSPFSEFTPPSVPPRFTMKY